MFDEEFFNRFPVVKKAIEREQQVLKLRNSMKFIVETTVLLIQSRQKKIQREKSLKNQCTELLFLLVWTQCAQKNVTGD